VLVQPRFTYRSLDTSKNELRLLQVLLDSENEQICCLFTHASLDAQPRYDGLSYAWQELTTSKQEELDRRESVVVSGACLDIRRNLAAFLCTARKLGLAEHFWIDANLH
jgi:hypothetical protein